MAVAALLATSSGLASAIPADAGRPADGAATLSARATLADGARVDSRSEIDRLEKYWTPERMAKAVPADVPGPRAAPRVNESSAVGKVYFRNPVNGGDYMCSAAAINSPSKQMVTTAGHCVNTGGVNGVAGHWMQNWVYIPRYRSGARPFGTYAAKEYRSFNGWINSGDLTRDVAMVTTWPLNGARVVDATGGHGLSWNFSRTQHMTVLGYPGNKDNGELQWACQGTTQQDGAGPKIAMHCDFGGGSSGGPWLRELNDANGLGSQNGVMSTISSGGWNQSPYFDDPVKAMFDAQGSIT